MSRARPVIRQRPMIRRRVGAAVAVAGLVAGLATGCVPASAWNSMDACRAASAVTATPTDDVEGLAEALEVLGTHLPSPEQAAALVLAQPLDASTEEQAETLATARLEALLTVQIWVYDACESYFTVGSTAIDRADAASVLLADADVIIGRGNGAVTVAVLGVTNPDVALVLCEQAVTEYAAPGLTVTVFDPVSDPVALGTRDGCELVAS